MSRCSHKNCQYEPFLKEIFLKDCVYISDNDNSDIYCIFHAHQKLKENFILAKIELFEKMIFEYIRFVQISTTKYIDFSNVVFTNKSFLENKSTFLDLQGYELDFSGAIFLQNIRFDNIKCKKLIFHDSEFLNGGGIKNKGGNKNLEIEELVFEPYTLHSDFVIDIGKYAKKDKSLIQDNKGIIKKIKFENHKIGEGYIFFIGLNQETEEAHFENMLLDKVYFFNCDLTHCYFLNSKIEDVEFTNCTFPKMKNVAVPLKINDFIITVIIFIVAYYVYSIIPSYMEESEKAIYAFLSISLYGFSIVLILFIFMFLAIIDKFVWKFLAFIRLDNSFHFCIADAQHIYKNKNQEIKATLESLSSIYLQLKNNFKEKDYQLSGDFFYAQRYTELLLGYENTKKNIPDLYLYHIHHFTNGFGEKFLRPIITFVTIVILYIFVFDSILKPNRDYISTSSTPFYLVENIKKENGSNNLFVINDANSSFMKTIELENVEYTKQMYGYNMRGNYAMKSQYIFRLKESIDTALMKSLSNILYPFSFGNKKWFQDVSREAFFASILETILLWYFAGAALLALWHRIKR